MNYYSAPDPQKTMKMVGLALGGIFGVVFIVAIGLFIHLLKPSFGTAAAAVAQQQADATKQDQAAAAAAVKAPAQPEAAQASADKAPTHHRASAHVASAKHASKSGSKLERPVAKGQASAILARHDSVKNRKAKDDLDKLLGL